MSCLQDFFKYFYLVIRSILSSAVRAKVLIYFIDIVYELSYRGATSLLINKQHLSIISLLNRFSKYRVRFSLVQRLFIAKEVKLQKIVNIFL